MVASSTAMRALDNPLFDLLDAVVRAETRRDRLDGRVAIGVHGADGTAWWLADLVPRLAVSRETTRPEADAWLLTTGTEAARWASGQGLSEAPRLKLAGDRGLIERFLQSYLRKQDAVSLRRSADPSPRRKKRGR